METEVDPNNIEPIEMATPAWMSDVAGLGAAASPETGGLLRGRLLSAIGIASSSTASTRSTSSSTAPSSTAPLRW
jgi:hypothetical protein